MMVHLDLIDDILTPILITLFGFVSGYITGKRNQKWRDDNE